MSLFYLCSTYSGFSEKKLLVNVRKGYYFDPSMLAIIWNYRDFQWNSVKLLFIQIIIFWKFNSLLLFRNIPNNWFLLKKITIRLLNMKLNGNIWLTSLVITIIILSLMTTSKATEGKCDIIFKTTLHSVLYFNLKIEVNGP